MKRLIQILLVLFTSYQVSNAQQSISITSGAVTISSNILNPVSGSLPELVPCVDLLEQEITITNNSGITQDVSFTIDVLNNGITLNNLSVASSWFDVVTNISGSTQYVFTVLGVLDGQTLTSPSLDFLLDCNINTNNLSHELVFQGTNELQNYNAVPTVMIYQGSGATVSDALGEELTFSSHAELTSGASKVIRLEFDEEAELDITTVNVTFTSATFTTVSYDYLSSEFDQANATLLADITSLFADGTWDFGDGDIEIDINFTLSDCSNPNIQTFTEVTVQNQCFGASCGDASVVSYDAEAVAANKFMVSQFNIISADDICSNNNPGGEFDVRIKNPNLGSTVYPIGTGGKALTSFAVNIDFNVIAFDKMYLVDQANNMYELVDFIGTAPSTNPADFTVNAGTLGQLSVINFTGAGQHRMRFSFDFYNDATSTQDDLTGTHWENVFDDILYAGTIGELQNGMAEGDFFDIKFTNVQFVGGDNTKNCGSKVNAGNPTKNMSFFSLSQHGFLDMCTSTPKVEKFANSANCNIHIRDNEFANSDYHTNNKMIYWNGSLGMLGSNYNNLGDPMVGVDLLQGAQVLLEFDILEQPLAVAQYCDPDGSYGATEYNPWNFTHNIFGIDTRDQVEYWAVVDLPNGLDLQSAGSISFDYNTLTGSNVSAPINYIVPTADIVNLGVVGSREFIAIPLFISGVDIHNVLDITLPLALNCSSFSTSCTGPAVAMPDGDVKMEIRAYRCPLIPNIDPLINQVNFDNTLYLTTACGEFEFLIHCNGLCGSPIGAGEDDIFVLERSSFGWTDDKTKKITGFDANGNAIDDLNALISGLVKADISTDRVYPFDKLKVEMTGHLSTYYYPCGDPIVCPCQPNGQCCIVELFPSTSPVPVFEFLPSISWEAGSVPGGLFDLSDQNLIVELYPTSVDLNVLPLPTPSISVSVNPVNANFSLNTANVEKTEYTFEIDAANNQVIANYLHANPGNYKIRFITELKTNNVGSGNTAYPFVLLSQKFGMTVNGSLHESCDPWSTDLTYLHPEVKELRSWIVTNAHGGSGSHACSNQIRLQQSLTSVLGDDFPNEFRPWLQWPEELVFEVENGTFDGFTISHPNAPLQGNPGYYSSENLSEVYPTFVEQTDIGPGQKEITFRLANDPNSVVPFFWDAVERGNQRLNFIVRRLCPNEPGVVRLKNHAGKMVKSSPEFFVGPEDDLECSEPATYNEGSSSWGTQPPELKPYNTPVSIALINPITNSQDGISNPTCWNMRLSNSKFIENVWIEIEDPDDYITGITINRINYQGIHPTGGIIDEMYEDGAGNWVGYLGTINRMVGHSTTTSSSNISVMTSLKYSDYEICFEYACGDVNNDFIEPTIRVGWDCSIANSEIYNTNYNSSVTPVLGVSDINDVVAAISDIDAGTLLLEDWILNRSVCGTISSDVHLIIDPKLSVIDATNNDPDGAITMDPCSGITEGLDFTISSLGDADIGEISSTIVLPPGLLGANSINSLIDIIDLNSSMVTVCSQINAVNFNALILSGDLIITEDIPSNSIILSLNSSIILDGHLSNEPNPCFEAIFSINFNCIPVNYQNAQIVIYSEGMDVCGNALPAQFPLTVSFSNLFPEPSFGTVSIPASTGSLDCNSNTIQFGVDIENSILPLLAAEGTFVLADMVVNSLIIQSSNVDYSIQSIDQTDLSNVLVNVTYTGNIIPCNILSSLFSFSVDFSKSCSSECGDLSSTISGTFDLCPFMISINNVVEAATSCGECNGELDFEVSNGTSPYSYTLIESGGNSYSGPVGNNPMNLTGICSGTYTLIITDSDGCEVQSMGVSIAPSDPLNIVADVFQIACPGGKGSVENVVVSNGSGNYIYRWRDSNGFVISLSSDLLNMTAGSYSLEVEDAITGCVLITDYTILPYTGESMDIYVLAEAPYCFTDPMNEVISSFVYDANFDYSSGFPNYTYTWVSNNGNTAVPQTHPMRFTLDNNTIYTVTVTDISTGCTANAQITVEVGYCGDGCPNPPCGGGTGSGSCTININGTLLDDADNDLGFSAGDVGLNAWDVNLDVFDIVWSGVAPSVPISMGFNNVASTTTSNTGYYSFSNNFTWGVYLLEEVIQTNWNAILPPLGRQTVVIGGCQDVTEADFLNTVQPCEPLVPNAVFNDIEDAANSPINVNQNWCSDDYCFANGPLTTMDGTADGPKPGCAQHNHPVRNNKWASFRTTTGEIEVELYSNGNSGDLRGAYLALWDWNDDGDGVLQNAELTLLDCQRYINATGLLKLSVTASGLSATKQYYVSIDNNVSSSYKGEFSLCIIDKASNDIIEGAELLTMNDCTVPSSDHLSPFTTYNGSTSYHISGISAQEKPGCAQHNHPVRNNKWFSFQTSTGEVEVELYSDGLGGDLKAAYLTLWDWNDDGDGILEPSELLQLDCQKYISVTGSQELSVTASGLDIGSQYYVSVDNNVSPNYAGEFSLCVYNQASNDIIEGAEFLTMNNCNSPVPGHLSPFTTHNGSVSKHLPGISAQEKPGCAQSNHYIRNNKWFSFQTSTGEVEVELYSDGVSGDLKGAYLTLWDWNDDGDGILEPAELFELDCQKYINITGLQELSVTASGLDIGSQYYVSVDNNVSPNYAGEFSLCVYDQASNDIIEGAEFLTMNNCNSPVPGHLSPFTTHNGSVSKHLPGISTQEKPGCAQSNHYIRNNKWFSFQTSTGEVEVELYSDGVSGDLKGAYLTLWDWNDDGDGILEPAELFKLDCQKYINITGLQELSVTASGLDIGSQYYVSVDNNVSPNYAGEFSLCVYDQASNDILEGAEIVLMNTMYSNGTFGHLGAFTTCNGSKSEHLPGISAQEKPTCAASNHYIRSNKWFSFQATSTDIDVELYTDGVSGDLKGPYVALWEWNDDGDGILENTELNQLFCKKYGYVTGYQLLVLNASSLTVGGEYFVSVDNNVSPAYYGEFSIQLVSTSSKKEENAEESGINEDLTIDENGIKVYPNPSADIFNFEIVLKENSTVSLELYSLEGKKIKDLLIASELDKGNHVIGFNSLGLSVGVYHYRLLINEKWYNGKVMKLE